MELPGFFIFPLGFILLRKRFAIPRVFYLRPNSARKCIDRLKTDRLQVLQNARCSAIDMYKGVQYFVGDARYFVCQLK